MIQARTRAFVEACKRERDAMLAQYGDPDSGSAVSIRLTAAKLDARQRRDVLAAIDVALTDAYYTMLLGLTGASSLGGIQQQYRLADESGHTLSPSGDADLE